ncbi:hypothetical protein GGR56DRAFT_570275 [Xylariaceae sp. FL0804]|nr:hypothetical protein GGR56DRAFT_570275 [Xylariaceae sp. FL0804]
MDQLASVLLAFPPDEHLADDQAYDKATRTHVGRLAKLLKEQNRDLATHGAELLKLLDPAVNSLSCVALLHTLLLPSPASSVSREFLLEKLVAFLMSFDGRQCRYASLHLSDILSAAGNQSLLPPSVATEALATAILRLDPSGSILTTNHTLLTQLAYHTDNIEPALQVIDKSIVFYPGMANSGNPKFLCDTTLSPPLYISRDSGLTNNLTPAAVMKYDLTCGLMYCARREWAKAYAAFERVITYPTREGGASTIMVEAYKKWVLVGLLSKGNYCETPSSAGSNASKAYGVLGKPYKALASLFATDDVQGLKAEADSNGALWLEDRNTGLVQEVLSAYQKWRVLGLRDVYTKLSIAEVREQTLSAETGAQLPADEDVVMLVQNMIIEGMLEGVVEKNDDGTVFLAFLPPGARLTEREFHRELGRAALRLKQLQPVFRATNERLGTSRDYVRSLVKEEARRGGKGGIEHLDPTIGGFDATVDDEDLMGGIIATG